MLSSRLKIPRFHGYKGNVSLPGSKSIANRALLCAALSQGDTHIHNIPQAQDVEILIAALAQLGVAVNHKQTPFRGSYSISGCGKPFPIQKAHLHLGNAGTSMRPLCAILCASHGHFILEGNKRMHERPISDLVEALASLGIDIKCQTNGCPPVEIHSKGLKGGKVKLSATTSSQFVSALLLAAPLGQQGMLIELTEEPVSQPYIDLTIAILKDFSISVEKKTSRSFYIPAPQSYISPQEFHIEGDATAATYFLGAGALPGCGPVRVHGIGSQSHQGDLQFLEILQQMGANTQIEKDSIEVQGPTHHQMTRLRSLDTNMNAMPDAAMTLAVLALFTDGTTHIRGIGNLRLKESERIQGLKTGLEQLGAKVEAQNDSLHITAPKKLQPATIETYDDHRMAMAFSLAAYSTDVVIKNPSCTAKTYRNFFDDFLPLCIS